MLQYLAVLTSLVILGNAHPQLEITVGNEKPTQDFAFNPILPFGNRFNSPASLEDKVFDGEDEQTNEQPEVIDNAMQTEHSSELENSNSETSYYIYDEDNDDDVCDNETNWIAVEYVTKLLLQMDIPQELVDAGKIQEEYENLKHVDSLFRIPGDQVAENQDDGTDTVTTGILFSDILAAFLEMPQNVSGADNSKESEEW